MIELIIIADDLTGAIEAGVLVAKQDIATRVIHNPEIALKQSLSELDVSVLVFNTESRHIQPALAAERVRKVIKQGQLWGVKRFYKKTDSTMRGNIGAEVEALLNETEQPSLVFIPAHPKLKRFTKKGFHYIGDQLLHETEFGRDPLEPMDISFIPEILAKQTGLPIQSIDPTSENLVGGLKDIWVLDCQSESEIKNICGFLTNHELHHVMAGSAAMVEFLPRLYDLEPVHSSAPEIQSPILIVNGSLNPISLKQVQYARDNGVVTYSIPEELLTDAHFKNNVKFSPLRAQLKVAKDRRMDVILNSTYIEKDNPNMVMHSKPFAVDHFGETSCQLGKIIAALLDELKFNTLAVFGGDTVSGIMQALSCEFIEPKQEILPGVALSLAITENQVIQLITKPGGYGSTDVLIQLLAYIKNSEL